MLKSIEIHNYALIEELHIAFHDGFSVITGETGAGKSIIIGAISLILGERAETKYIRKGSKKCTIEARFALPESEYAPFFEANDLDFDADGCTIRRELLDSGKSRAFINDTPVSVSVLKELGENLIDVHSQHQNLLLNRESFVIDIVDTVAATDKEKAAYAAAYRAHSAAQKEWTELAQRVERDRADREYISFQLARLDEADLREDEQEELEKEADLLNNTEEIKQALYDADSVLNGDESELLSSLNSIASDLQSISRVYEEAGELASRIESCHIELQDIASEVSDMLESVDFDPRRLEYINERLGTIYSLQKKHHVADTASLLAIHRDLQKRFDAIESGDDELAHLETLKNEAHAKMLTLAEKLSAKRKKAGAKIEKEVAERLQQLGMPNVQFRVDFAPKSSPDTSGIDAISLLFNANKKGELQNITQIASGGEIARVMLSLKALLSSTKMLPTIIFDEIDTGVSGRIAEKMAMTMKEIALHRQVLSITHLPQIAAYGAHHYLVYKEDKADETHTHIIELSSERRVEEIAHMLSGASITEAAIENAKELLKNNAS